MVNVTMKHKRYTPALAGFEAVREETEILIVSETAAHSLEGMMLAAGYTVTALTFSAAAGHYLRKHSPGLIIDVD